jgi:RND family efflux transporter MFP subunit
MSDAVTSPPGLVQRAAARVRANPIALGLAAVFGLLLMLGVVPRLRARWELAAAVKAAATTPPRVPVAKPRAAEPIPLELPGMALAYQQSTLYGRANGYLERRLVDIGDRVKAGQLLAVISAPDLDQQLAEAKGVLAQASANRAQQKANLEYGRTSLRRYEEANHDGAVAQLDLDTRRNAVATAEAALQAADAAVKAAVANVGQLSDLQGFERVTAPFDGIITQRNVDAGQLITAGSGSALTPLFTLAQDDVLRVNVNVPQPFVDQLQVGHPASITTRTVPGRTFEAVVARMAGALDPNARTMLVEIDIPNSQGLLKPGMYLQVKLVTERVGTRWRIPASALVIDAKGTQVVVVDPKNHAVERRPVVLGYDYGSEVEVYSGLQGDETLVTSPSAEFSDGTIVEPVERK